MEIEANCIVSPDSYEKFSLSDTCRVSNETVQDFFGRDLMSKDAVYQRYTQKLSQIVANGLDVSSELERIKQAFHQLCNPEEAEYLSHSRFNRFMSQKLYALDLSGSLNNLTLLFDILSWHAFFPFSTSNIGSEIPCINKDAFLRAVCLLTLDPASRYAPKFSAARHGVSSGTWGPFEGWLIRTRGKDAIDFNRRLFRSLAVPNSTITSHERTIPVPRFIMYQPQQYEQDSEENPEQQIVIVQNESERFVDIHDVLSECPPEEDSLTANPLRESYNLILSSLQLQPNDLASLDVPTTRLVALLKLVQAMQATEKRCEQDTILGMIALAENLDCKGKLSWEQFNTVMSKKGGLIADVLSKIFKIFRAPLEKTVT